MTEIKVLTTIIFDLDDTLCRYRTSLEEGLLEAFSVSQPDELPLTPDEYREGFGVEFDKAIDGQVDRPGTEFRTRIFLNILKDKHYAEERILDLGRKFARIREDSLVLYEDVEDLFENLTGKFKLGLLTNGPSNLQRRKIDVLGIDSWFDEIIVSGEHDLAKPDPRIFYIALEELNSDPEKTIYVGNSLEYDVLGANNAGVPVIWKKNGEDNPGMEEAKPSFVINELRELIHQDRISSSSEGEKRSIKS